MPTGVCKSLEGPLNNKSLISFLFCQNVQFAFTHMAQWAAGPCCPLGLEKGRSFAKRPLPFCFQNVGLPQVQSREHTCPLDLSSNVIEAHVTLDSPQIWLLILTLWYIRWSHTCDFFEQFQCCQIVVFSKKALCNTYCFSVFIYVYS